MPLTDLRPLGAKQFDALGLLPFMAPPHHTCKDNPERRVSIELNGWLGYDVLVFTVTMVAETNTKLRISETGENTIDVAIVGGRDPVSHSTYWRVNLGPDARNTDWHLNFDVWKSGEQMNHWEFTKGKIENRLDQIVKNVIQMGWLRSDK